MTREESIKILSILKAAFPNSYKGMTKEEANGVVGVWSTQFVNIPYSVVSIAINKLISTNTFPPSIGEVKEKIRSLYWEAWGMENQHNQALSQMKYIGESTTDDRILDERTLATVQEIIRVCEPMRTKEILEPTLSELLSGYGAYLSGGESDGTKLIEGS